MIKKIILILVLASMLIGCTPTLEEVQQFMLFSCQWWYKPGTNQILVAGTINAVNQSRIVLFSAAGDIQSVSSALTKEHMVQMVDMIYVKGMGFQWIDPFTILPALMSQIILNAFLRISSIVPDILVPIFLPLIWNHPQVMTQNYVTQAYP